MSLGKPSLRKKFRQIRLSMSREEVETKSGLICQMLLQGIDWEEKESLLVYKPIKKLNEVDLSFFTVELKSKRPGIKIGVLSAESTHPPPDKKYDAILVPVLAFDKNRHRLGWGSGWYDRFLASQTQAQKIGLGFENGFFEPGLPHEKHDIRLDKIITEKRLY
jgi:5-formyltetrahydrofolate cyclo-ligase